MDAYRINPHWAVTTQFAGLDGPRRLVPSDLALLLRVVGAVVQSVPADREQVVEFESSMRDAVSRGDGAPGFAPVEFGLREAGLRNADFAARAVERLRDVTNRGDRCFHRAETVYAGNAVGFTPAGGRAVMTAHPMFAGQTLAVPSSTLLYSDRHYVAMWPDVVARMATVASVPIALRVLAWLHTPIRDGLPPHHHADVDAQGRWTVRCRMEGLCDLWGIFVPAVRHGEFERLFRLVADDLARVGVRFKSEVDRLGKMKSNWVFRFWAVEAEQAWLREMGRGE